VSETRLRQAFVEVLGVPQDIEWSSLKYRGIEEWDSVAHMQLVAEIEDAFNIMIDTQDVIDMSSYEVTKTILAKYGVAFD